MGELSGQSAPEPFTTGVRPFAAEGARVGLVTCLRCGAAILLDPSDAIDPVAVHRAWHLLVEGPRDG